MTDKHYILQENNLSVAWAKVMIKMLSKGVTEICPLVVNVQFGDGRAVEIPEIKAAADEVLEQFGNHSCDTTANTIFPNSLWTPGGDRHVLYQRYKDILPRLKKYSTHGTYFGRLIAYNGTINQLEHILKTREKGTRRRSEMQATIVEPANDQSDTPMLGFPCLRQVMFIPGTDGLTISGVYGVQYIFERAYGNYLGLYRLGQFMAHEMGLSLVRLQCVTTIAQRGEPSKTALTPLAQHLSSLLQRDELVQMDGANPEIGMSNMDFLNKEVEEEENAQAR